MGGEYEVGMVGLGVMGRNLVLNIAGHGFSVAGYDNDAGQTELMRSDAGDLPVVAVNSEAGLAAALRPPRAVMMLVPAGKVVDAVISGLVPHLAYGDLIIDCGNSFFKDTSRREQELAARGINYLGVGVSGGEEGARHGPSIMPGGKAEAYERVRAILEAAAAHVGGDPCVAYLGPGAAGHYVKMVHNGIEYAIMQLISEAYDVMKRGLGMGAAEMQTVFSGWNRGGAGSFLMEITADILGRTDGESGRPLVDMIRDEARQLGTGKWTSQDAMNLGVPVPSIDIAVAMRNLSGFKAERARAAEELGGAGAAAADGGGGAAEGGSDGGAGAGTEVSARFPMDRGQLLGWLEDAYRAAATVAYAQGMAQLKVASGAYGYGLNLETVARIWRGGCIIRAALLEDIRQAYLREPDLPNMLLDGQIGAAVLGRREALRAVAGAAAQLGIPVPGLAVCLAYFDAYRSRELPANLIQAQRDYFGSHRYQRVDRDGTFHTEWTPE